MHRRAAPRKRACAYRRLLNPRVDYGVRGLGDVMKFRIVIAAALFAAPAMAQDDKKIDCANAQVQFEMNICANRAYEAADKSLNEIYLKILASEDASGKNRLKAAQRAWLKFRDLECDFESAVNEGGTMYPMVYSGCLQGLTEERTKQLRYYQSCQSASGDCKSP
jgi:uncharacterized protein YecT (DUF1311 family)